MCATPTTTTTPTATGSHAGIFAWLQSVAQRATKDSSKRVIALAAALTCCASTLALAVTICLLGLLSKPVPAAIIGAFLGSQASTITLAGVAYRKPEGTDAA